MPERIGVSRPPPGLNSAQRLDAGTAGAANADQAAQQGHVGGRPVQPGAGSRLQATPGDAAQAWQRFQHAVSGMAQRVGEAISTAVMGSRAQRADRAANQLAQALRAQVFDQGSLGALDDLVRHCAQAEPKLFPMALLRSKLGDAPLSPQTLAQVDRMLNKQTGLDQARQKSAALLDAMHQRGLGSRDGSAIRKSMQQASPMVASLASLRRALTPEARDPHGANASGGFASLLTDIRGKARDDALPTSDINRFNRDAPVVASPGLVRPEEQALAQSGYQVQPASSFVYAQVSALDRRGLNALHAMCAQGPTRLERLAAGTRLEGAVGTPARNAEQQAIKLLQAVPAAQRQQLLIDIATTDVDQLRAQLRPLLPSGRDEQVAQSLVQGALRLLSGSNRVLDQTETTRLGYPTVVQFNGKRFDHAKVLGEGGANGLGHLFKAADGTAIVLKQSKLQYGEDNDTQLLEAIQNELRVHQHAMAGPAQAPGRDNVVALQGLITMPAGEQTARRTYPSAPNNPNVQIRLHRLGETFIVTEAVVGGEMADLMTSLDTLRRAAPGNPGAPAISPQVHDLLARQLFAQLVDGMVYLQTDRQVIHHDLKPENILMSADGGVKIIDFGNASVGGDVASVGSPFYMSPEATAGLDQSLRERTGRMGGATDTWSLGVLFQRLMNSATAGQVPADPVFLGAAAEPNSMRDLQEQLAAWGPADRAYTPRPAMGGFRELLNAMLDADPAQRPGLQAVQAHHVVSDPMLQDSNVKALIRLLVAPGDLASKATQIADLNQRIETAVRQGVPDFSGQPPA